MALPSTCSATIDDLPTLTTLDEALDKTDGYDAIDTMPNVTCLTPDNAAFSAAGNPQDSLANAPLTNLIL